LREADEALAEVDAVGGHLDISLLTYWRWRSWERAMRPEEEHG
jgi:hypothetical protein